MIILLYMNTIYVAWAGTNPITPNRLKCLEQINIVKQCKVILITPQNLDQYILSSAPLHHAYQYLSETQS